MGGVPFPPERWAWIAGVIEADGCITSRKGKEPRVIVTMTDRDVVQRLYDWSELGAMRGPHLPNNGHNVLPMWTWSVSGGRQLRVLLPLVMPYLCSRRHARALEALEYCNSTIGNAEKTHCKHGHRFTKRNTYLHRGRRHCMKCRADASQRLRARLEEVA